MARTIWKYIIEHGNGFELSIPTGGFVHHVAMQGRQLAIWVGVDPSEELQRRRFVVIGTGSDIPDNHLYCGTALDGPLVWHVFESMEPAE